VAQAVSAAWTVYAGALALLFLGVSVVVDSVPAWSVPAAIALCALGLIVIGYIGQAVRGAILAVVLGAVGSALYTPFDPAWRTVLHAWLGWSG